MDKSSPKDVYDLMIKSDDRIAQTWYSKVNWKANFGLVITFECISKEDHEWYGLHQCRLRSVDTDSKCSVEGSMFWDGNGVETLKYRWWGFAFVAEQRTPANGPQEANTATLPTFVQEVVEKMAVGHFKVTDFADGLQNETEELFGVPFIMWVDPFGLTFEKC